VTQAPPLSSQYRHFCFIHGRHRRLERGFTALGVSGLDNRCGRPGWPNSPRRAIEKPSPGPAQTIEIVGIMRGVEPAEPCLIRRRWVLLYKCTHA
jgi:hypothetical protein